MISGVPYRFDHFVDHRAAGWPIRIAHPEVDYVLLIRAQPRLHLVYDGEYVGRQLTYAVKLIGRSRHTRIVSKG